MKNIPNSNTIFYALLLLVLPFSFSGCKKDETPGANEVFMQSSSFSPSSITVSVNTTVKWIDKSGVEHNVTSNTGLFSSGNITGGGTYSYKFTAAGTYPYRCTIHSGMSGMVIVQ
jgi:plastocyanin